MKYVCKESGACPQGKITCCYTCQNYETCPPEDKCIIPDGRDFVKCATVKEDKQGA